MARGPRSWDTGAPRHDNYLERYGRMELLEAKSGEELQRDLAALRELERVHETLIRTHLEKELRSTRVLREMRHADQGTGP